MLLRNCLKLAFTGILTLSYATPQERLTEPDVVIRKCSRCHGTDGNSQLPYVPRLAGMNTTYMEHKLASLRAAAAASPVNEVAARLTRSDNMRYHTAFAYSASVSMVRIAASLSTEDLNRAAEWYSAQRPVRRPTSIKSKAFDEGKDLYTNGARAQGLHNCECCHGPEGLGTEVAPRLAGQNAAYAFAQLGHFRTGASDEMTAIARSLQDDQIRAIAAYLRWH